MRWNSSFRSFFFRSLSYCILLLVSNLCFFSTTWTWEEKMSRPFWLILFQTDQLKTTKKTPNYWYLQGVVCCLKYILLGGEFAWLLQKAPMKSMYSTLLTSDIRYLAGCLSIPLNTLPFLRVFGKILRFFLQGKLPATLEKSSSSGMSYPVPPPKASSQFFGGNQTVRSHRPGCQKFP